MPLLKEEQKTPTTTIIRNYEFALWSVVNAGVQELVKADHELDKKQSHSNPLSTYLFSLLRASISCRLRVFALSRKRDFT